MAHFSAGQVQVPRVWGGLRVEVRHQTRAKIIHRAVERCLCLNPASSLPAGRGRAGCVAVAVMGDGRGEAAALGLGVAPRAPGSLAAPAAAAARTRRPAGACAERGAERGPLPVTEPLTRARGCGRVSPSRCPLVCQRLMGSR